MVLGNPYERVIWTPPTPNRGVMTHWLRLKGLRMWMSGRFPGFPEPSLLWFEAATLQCLATSVSKMAPHPCLACVSLLLKTNYQHVGRNGLLCLLVNCPIVFGAFS